MDIPRSEVPVSQVEKNRQEMTELLIELPTAEGIVATCLEDARIVRANAHYAREPVFFEPSIVILANVCKKFYLGEQTVTYDPNHYYGHDSAAPRTYEPTDQGAAARSDRRL